VTTSTTARTNTTGAHPPVTSSRSVTEAQAAALSLDPPMPAPESKVGRITGEHKPVLASAPTASLAAYVQRDDDSGIDPAVRPGANPTSRAPVRKPTAAPNLSSRGEAEPPRMGLSLVQVGLVVVVVAALAFALGRSTGTPDDPLEGKNVTVDGLVGMLANGEPDAVVVGVDRLLVHAHDGDARAQLYLLRANADGAMAAKDLRRVLIQLPENDPRRMPLLMRIAALDNDTLVASTKKAPDVDTGAAPTDPTIHESSTRSPP
jgi:hypothetical protein